MSIAPRIHRFDQRVPFPVNAFIIEGRNGCVVVDGLLTVTASKSLRRKIDELGKPLKGILVTHAHPDHYAGLGNIAAGRVPIFAVEAVRDVIQADDAVKDSIVGPMFGDEWPQVRVFPDQIAKPGSVLTFDDDLKFEVVDIGPAESRHDSMFVLHAPGCPIFIGDLVYSFMHAYMADGMIEEWKSVLTRLAAELDESTVLYPGHGAPITSANLSWQKSYLETFEAALRQANWTNPAGATDDVVARMKSFLPSDDLVFLMQLSIEPVARQYGLLK